VIHWTIGDSNHVAPLESTLYVYSVREPTRTTAFENRIDDAAGGGRHHQYVCGMVAGVKRRDFLMNRSMISIACALTACSAVMTSSVSDVGPAAGLVGPPASIATVSHNKMTSSIPDMLDRRSVTIDGNTLDPAIQSMLAARRAVGETGLVVDDDAVTTRMHMRANPSELAMPSIPVAVTNLAIPGSVGPIPARHYWPPSAGPAPLLVFYHGGGLVYGDLDLYDDVARQICRDGGVHVLSVDYRLAPEHKAPAALDDAYAAFRWAAEHASGLGALPDRVAVGGDSAGGTLAAVVSQLARNDGGPVPFLQWLIYPVTDADAHTRSRELFANGFLLTTHDLDWFNQQYLDGAGITADDPRVSPLRAKDLSGLPPALVIIAGFDPLRDEGKQYATAMQAAGDRVDLHEMPMLTHAFINLGALGGASSTGIAEIISELRIHLSGV
jgi:acetyl esterase